MKNKTLLTTLTLLGLVVILIVVEFYFQSYLVGVVSNIAPKILMITVNIVIFIVVLLLFILTRKLFLSAKQEKIVEVQELYIGHLRELVKFIRSQRHDFVNHLQAVYVLLKTGEIEKAQKYIEELYQDVKITGEILRVNIPELSALLMVKTGVATARDISFVIEIESNLKMLKIKPIEINTVVGNLLDNAFEAVEFLKAKDKRVALKIFETSKWYVFQVGNTGYISQELLSKLFIPGFSTKPGGKNKGFGLASVKSVVEKNKGRIIVSSNKKRGIKFTVILPKGN
jgi:sensor histidine kinase regulating citrate/malate metabolism